MAIPKQPLPCDKSAGARGAEEKKKDVPASKLQHFAYSRVASLQGF